MRLRLLFPHNVVSALLWDSACRNLAACWEFISNWDSTLNMQALALNTFSTDSPSLFSWRTLHSLKKHNLSNYHTNIFFLYRTVFTYWKINAASFRKYNILYFSKSFKKKVGFTLMNTFNSILMTSHWETIEKKLSNCQTIINKNNKCFDSDHKLR